MMIKHLVYFILYQMVKYERRIFYEPQIHNFDGQLNEKHQSHMLSIIETDSILTILKLIRSYNMWLHIYIYICLCVHATDSAEWWH